MRKQDVRKLKPEVQEAIRLRVVDFLREGKGTQQQAAGIFQISLRAVEKAWHRYKAEGRRALQAKKRGPHRSTARLSRRQAATIKTLVKKDTPEAYGLPYFLWTAEAVRRLIKKKHE